MRRFLLALSRRMEEWRRSRKWRRMIAAIPALTVCLAIVASIVFFANWARFQRMDRYREIAATAMAGGEHETARLAFARLARLDPDRKDEYLFQIAMCLDRLGQKGESMRLLEHLAPLDRPGVVPAHLALASRLASSTNAADPAVFRVVEQHLLNALAAEPKSIDVRIALAQFYLNQRQYVKVEEHLREVSAARPDVSLLLSFVLAAQGKESGAMAWAGIAERYFRMQTILIRDRAPDPRINWANALAAGRRYPEAITVLEDGWKKTTNNVYRPIMGKVYALWARALNPSNPALVPQRLKLIQQGLQISPQDQTLLEDLIAVSRLDGPDSGKAADEIRRLLAIGEGSAILHFCLGVDAWKRNDYDRARQHFEFAYQRLASMPVVANNMAWTLAASSRPDLPHAHAIIQSLVDRFPDNPDFRETRGQILVRMGKMREAIEDLEYALPRIQQRDAAHRALAEAYRSLGMGEISREHERRLEIERPASGAIPTPDPATGAPPHRATAK